MVKKGLPAEHALTIQVIGTRKESSTGSVCLVNIRHVVCNGQCRDHDSGGAIVTNVVLPKKNSGK